MSEQAQTTTVETTATENKEPSKWKKAAKYVGIGIAAAGLGVAGFFGMKYYAEHKS